MSPKEKVHNLAEMIGGVIRSYAIIDALNNYRCSEGTYTLRKAIAAMATEKSGGAWAALSRRRAIGAKGAFSRVALKTAHSSHMPRPEMG